MIQSNIFLNILGRIRSTYEKRRHEPLRYTDVTIIKDEDFTKLTEKILEKTLVVFVTKHVFRAFLVNLFRSLLRSNIATLLIATGTNSTAIFTKKIGSYVADGLLVETRTRTLEFFCDELPFYSLKNISQKFSSTNLFPTVYFLTAYSFEVKRSKSFRKKLVLSAVKLFNLLYYNLLIPIFIQFQSKRP